MTRQVKQEGAVLAEAAGSEVIVPIEEVVS